MIENLDLPKSQLHKVIQMTVLDTFGMGLVSVFIPIFLLSHGYSVKMVMVWYIIQDLAVVISSYITVYFSNKIGLVHTLQIKFVFQAASLLALSFIPVMPVLFFLVPILVGMYLAFYYEPLNILFLRNTDRDSIGNSLSKLSAYPKFFSMFCPTIGAFIILNYGYNFLFILAILIIFVSSLPLWPLRSQKTHFTFGKNAFLKVWRENKSFFIPEIMSSVGETSLLVLNIFIYVRLLSVKQVGLIGSIVLLASVIFTISVGKLADKWNKHKMIKIASFFASIAWVICFSISLQTLNPWMFYVATFILSLSIRAFVVPYQSLLFNNARKSDAQFIVLREIPNVLGRMFVYAFGFIFAANLYLIFIIAALSFIYFILSGTRKLDSGALAVN